MSQPHAKRLLFAVALCALGAARLHGQTAGGGELNPPAAPEATSFEDCLAGIEREAVRRGIADAIATQNLRNLSPDPGVLAGAQGQAEFETPIWDYVDKAVSDDRVSTGQRKLTELAAVLDSVEGRFAVDRHILVAIWGIESSYGAVLEDVGIVRPVIRSLATLACGDASRAGYWRDELLAALQILDQGNVAPDRMTGSWAGAMGHSQFMPTVYQRYAVDFDGDGKRDIWRSIPDALASTANYLRSFGWQPGNGWGYEVELPQGFDYSLADETTERPLSSWLALGLRVTRDQPLTDAEAKAVLVLPTGARGPAFLLLPNFRVILRYNTAMAYALSVAYLSDRLRGAPPFAQSWPRDERMLTSAERKELQTMLASHGFELGTVDGKVGPKTRAAIRAYQTSVGLVPDGYPNGFVLERARADLAGR